MKHRITSSQPEPVRQKIYSAGVPVRPLDGPSDQPDVVAGTKVYGQRKTPTVRIRLRNSDDERVLVIAASEFDPERHERIDAR